MPPSVPAIIAASDAAAHPAARGRNHAREWILFAALLGAVFWPVLHWMYERWTAADSYTSHGLLIPFVSAWFVYRLRHELRQLPRQPALSGLLLMGFALAVFFISGVLRVYFTSGFALLLCLAGMLAYWGGWSWARKLWFPLFFLVFMLPLPEISIARMNLILKLIVAKCAVACADFSGIPIVMDGARLHMQGGDIVIGDVCSGLRSMTALIALGVLYAYLYTGSSRLVRGALLCAVVPAAMLANVVRIYLNIAFAQIFGQEPLFRPLFESSWTGVVDLHLLSGAVLFVAALGLLYLTMTAAEKLSCFAKRENAAPAGASASGGPLHGEGP